MGDMADMMREDAEIALMQGYSEAQSLTLPEILEELERIMTNAKDDWGEPYHPWYEENDYTPMIKNICEKVKATGSITMRQRNALNNHYGIHCMPVERY